MMTRVVLMAVLCVFLTSTVASAGPLTWSFEPINLNFFFTGTASGHFTYDADTNTYSDWSFAISTASGQVTLPILESPDGDPIPLDGLWTPDTSSIDYADPGQLSLQLSGGNGHLYLSFGLICPPAGGTCTTTPLTNTGGTTDVFATVGAVGYEVDVPDYSSFWFAGGQGLASTPEPSSLGVIMLAGIMVCSMRVLGRRINRSNDR